MSTTRNNQARVELSIRGMHCAGCVASVERALKRTPGVGDARVNLNTESAVVDLVEARENAESALVEAVRAAGYEAKPVAAQGDRAAERRARREVELAWQKRGILIALVAGVPVIALHFFEAWITNAFGLATVPLWVAQAGLTVVVMVAAAGSMMVGALRALLARSANMDLLVMLGTLTAFLAGILGIVLRDPELILFHAATMIVLFVAAGKYAEARARGEASSALEALFSRIPTTALRVVDGKTESVPIERVRPGDLLRLTPHAPVPVDGVIRRDHVSVDESMLTGEPLPVERGEGARVFGGTRVAEGTAEMEATATGSDSAAARIAKLVEEAQASKPPWQRLADRVAGVFVPCIVVLALVTFAGWGLLSDRDLYWALIRAIAVLVVACPCAMGLAIPTAVLVGTSRAAEQGLLVRDASALEASGHIHEVLLDKTGTLTRGKPTVETIETYNGVQEGDLLRRLVAIEKLSEHPLARAVVAAAEQRGIESPEAGDYESKAGLGVRGVVEGAAVIAGSRKWLTQQGAALDEAPEASSGDEARSAMFVAIDGRLGGIVRFSDRLHPDAAETIRGLERLGISTRILSGDQRAAVKAVAQELGIEHWEAELSPDDKLQRVRERVASGVGAAMVGDGINDAPALAAADVGIAIGTGADVAREAGDICIVGDSPKLIERAIRISRSSGRVMKQNLVWAVIYNAVMLPVAILTAIPPAAATVAMMASSLSVVGNSLRLRRMI